MTIEERAEKGAQLKKSGSCNIASGFGAGMGNMEATCGALVGAVQMAGLALEGKNTMRSARMLAESFARQCGAVRCRDLKGKGAGAPLCACEDCVRNAIYAYGEIVDSETGSMLSQEHSIVATEVCKDLEELMNNDDVKAVVLRVNSPGGSAYASEQIWRAVTNLKAKKPVVVSMGGYAASGGYYISCNANYIYSEPTTLTGSIGIFGMFPDVSQLLTEKLGVKFSEVKTNKHSNFGTISRPFNAEELALLDNYIGRGYELFRQRVADGRKLPVAQVEEIAQGHVWVGNDALKIKLVDAIGSLDDAVKKAAQLAKLKEYYTTSYPDEPSWWESLTAQVDRGSYLDEQMRETLGEYYAPFSYLKNINKQSAIQARLPYFLEIK